MMKSILVTGGSGFAGSHFIQFLLNTPHKFKLINLDLSVEPDINPMIKQFNSEKRYTFVKGSINNFTFIKDLFETHQFDSVFNFAAETEVDHSLISPKQFFKTNITGTFNLLEAARLTWFDNPFIPKPDFTEARFHHISSADAYGKSNSEILFSETTGHAPLSPFGASKASSHFLVRCFHETYGLHATLSITAKLFGISQPNNTFISTLIKTAINRKPIALYDQADQYYDWIAIDQYCDAILTIFQTGKPGEAYNVSTRQCLSKKELIQQICKQLDQQHPRLDNKSYTELMSVYTNKPAQYCLLDPTKIETELAWKPKNKFKSLLRATVQHYIEQHEPARQPR